MLKDNVSGIVNLVSVFWLIGFLFCFVLAGLENNPLLS
jgi:hypothetical protein